MDNVHGQDAGIHLLITVLHPANTIGLHEGFIFEKERTFTKMTRYYKYTILFTLWLCFCMPGILLGQHVFEKIYDQSDGLPSLDLDGVAFTQEGQVIIRYATGEFYSWFDGVNWTHDRFTDHGLPSDLMFWMDDPNGWWFAKRNPDSLFIACRHPDNSWSSYSVPGFASISLDKKIYSPLVVDFHGNSWILSNDKQKFIRDKQFTPPALPVPDARVLGRNFYFDGTTPTYMLQANKLKYAAVLKQNRWEFIENHGLSFYYSGDIRDFRIIHGELFLFSKGQQHKIELKNELGQRLIVRNITGVRPWDNQRQRTKPAVITENPVTHQLALYQLSPDGIKTLLLSNVRTDHMNEFAQDAEGNWWYATATGLVRTNKAIHVFDSRDPHMIAGLHAIGEDKHGNIWMGGFTGSGGFSKWDGQKLTRLTTNGNARKILPGSHLDQEGYLYFFSQDEGTLRIGENKIPECLDPKNNGIKGYAFLPLSNGLIGLGLAQIGLGIGKLSNGELTQLHIIGQDKGQKLINVLTLAEDNRGRIWMGRLSQGISIYDPVLDTAVTWPRIPGKWQSLGALSSCIDSKGDLWIGAQDGLYRLTAADKFDYINSRPDNYWEKIPLPGNDTSRVGIIKELPDYMLIGTYEGIYFREKHGWRTTTLKRGIDIPPYGTEQNAVLKDSRGVIWIGTDGGALAIDLDQLHFDTTSTSFQLTSFFAGGQSVDITSHQIGSFPAEHRNIQFNYQANGNKMLQSGVYATISVVDQNGDTLIHIHQSQDNKIDLAYVPAGSYTIQIDAHKHGVISGRTTYSFVVPVLLKENIWFWSGLGILVFSLLGFWYRNYSKRQKDALTFQLSQESHLRERDALKAQALSNFFNPHFLNNSLHWIQSKYRKDPETALIIGRLSQNVDLLFANTREGRVTHSLTQEMIIVQNYLNVQEIRFGENLMVHLALPAEMELLDGYEVPALLLQIHAENAIEKGIRNRVGAKNFWLTIAVQNQHILITIEDDGRGRPESVILGRQLQNGSTSVMEDLITLYNKYNSTPLQIEYQDRVFTSASGELCGTRVNILIPKYYRYGFS